MVNKGLQRKIIAVLSDGRTLSNQQVFAEVNSRYKAGFNSYAQCWRMLSNMSRFTRRDVSPDMVVQFLQAHRFGSSQNRSADYKLVPRAEHRRMGKGERYYP